MVTQVAAAPNDKKKMILAIVLGLLALIALWFAFGRGLFASGTTTKIKINSSPKPSPSTSPKSGSFELPTAADQNFNDVTTPVVMPASVPAPDPGRNIFAFYEPPPPTPYSPTPVKTPEIKTPTPTPTPPYTLAFVNPQSVYAGASGFRLEINGDKFDPEAHIYFNQTELPTTYVNPQRIFADVPSNMISSEGSRQVIVQSPDGKKYSLQFMLTVQAPPKPTLTYIGMIGRKRFNNDTGYFVDPSKPNDPFGARINDVVGGRFRLIKLTPGEALVEDTTLGFKHHLPIAQPTAGASTSFGPPARGGVNPQDPGFPQFQQPINKDNCPPGIPCNNIRPINPPQQPENVRQPGQKDEKKEDVDDDNN